jgi:ammonium transporter, Amt family
MSNSNLVHPFEPRKQIANLGLQAFIPSANVTAKFPTATMVFFQFVFAAITVVLLAGAVLARMNFRAWMIFCPLWLTFSYTVGKFEN